MSFIYGIVYLLFEAIPIVFGGEHGLNAGETGLIFLALLLGGVTAVVIYVFYFNKKYMATHRAMKPTPVPPEQRLKPLFYSAPALAIAFFWFAFTSYPSISIWSPIFAIWLLGVCILCEFLLHPRSVSLLVSNADSLPFFDRHFPRRFQLHHVSLKSCSRRCRRRETLSSFFVAFRRNADFSLFATFADSPFATGRSDTYLWNAASALSINTVVRSAFGAGSSRVRHIHLLSQCSNGSLVSNRFPTLREPNVLKAQYTRSDGTSRRTRSRLHSGSFRPLQVREEDSFVVEECHRSRQVIPLPLRYSRKPHPSLRYVPPYPYCSRSSP